MLNRSFLKGRYAKYVPISLLIIAGTTGFVLQTPLGSKHLKAQMEVEASIDYKGLKEPAYYAQRFKCGGVDEVILEIISIKDGQITKILDGQYTRPKDSRSDVCTFSLFAVDDALNSSEENSDIGFIFSAHSGKIGSKTIMVSELTFKEKISSSGFPGILQEGEAIMPGNATAIYWNIRGLSPESHSLGVIPIIPNNPSLKDLKEASTRLESDEIRAVTISIES